MCRIGWRRLGDVHRAREGRGAAGPGVDKGRAGAGAVESERRRAGVRPPEGVEERLSQRIDGLDRRLIRIETVLILKGIMPQEMTAKKE